MRKGDFLAGILVLVLGFVLLAVQFGQAKGDVVEIYSCGEIYGKYDLLSTEKVTVVNEYGENTIVIDNGEVFVSQSTCSDKDEILQGSISRAGHSLICLPNQVVVTIKGREHVDSVSY